MLPEWLEKLLVRYESQDLWAGDRWGVGGTDWAAYLGVSKWKTPWDAWAIAHDYLKQDFQTAVMARGHKWQSRVLEDYAERTGFEVHEVLCRLQDPRRPWHRPSPDAFAREGDHWGLVDAKTASDLSKWGPDGTVIETWSEGSEDWLPVDYALQGYSMMEASGLPWIDFAVVAPDRVHLIELRIIRLLRDQTLQFRLGERVRQWYELHIVQGVEPDPGSSNHYPEIFAGRFPGAGDYRQATEVEEAAVRELSGLRKQSKDIDTRIRALSNQVLEACADHKGITVQTGGKPAKALVVRTAGHSSISAKKLQDNNPDLFKQVEAAGCVSHGKPSAQVRIYGL